MNSKYARGFSAIEILVVVFIIGLLAALVASSFYLFRENTDLNIVTERTLTMLRDARTKTLSSENGSKYGIHFTPTSITLFAGSTYNPTDPTNVVYDLPTSVTGTATLTDGATDLVFQRLTGGTTQDGTVVFQSTSNPSRTKTIKITVEGLIHVQ